MFATDAPVVFAPDADTAEEERAAAEVHRRSHDAEALARAAVQGAGERPPPLVLSGRAASLAPY